MEIEREMWAVVFPDGHITCNEENDGQLLEDAADELERTAAALNWAIRCLQSDGNFGAIANVNEFTQGNVPPARAYA